MTEQNLGTTLRQRREEMGLSLTEAANRMGVQKGYLSSLETGKIKRPELDRLRKVADVLGLPIVELVIASGQLTRDDLNVASVAATRNDAPGSEPIHALVNLVDWQREPIQARITQDLLQSFRKTQGGSSTRQR